VPLEASINLDWFRAVEVSDVIGRQPYVWPVTLWVDDTLVVGSLAPSVDDAVRFIVKNGIQNGDAVEMPAPQRTFAHRFEEGLTIRQMGVVAAFFEWNETPGKAVRAGYSTFVRELPQALTDFIQTHLRAPETPEDREEIRAAVEPKVVQAGKDTLSNWEKVQIWWGNLNLDVQLGFDAFFMDVGDVKQPATKFTLAVERHVEYPLFEIEGDVRYEVDGRLVVLPTTGPDPCQDQVERVNHAQAARERLRDNMFRLRTSAFSATTSPGERLRALADIRRILALELPPAEAELEISRYALDACRDQQAHL